MPSAACTFKLSALSQIFMNFYPETIGLFMHPYSTKLVCLFFSSLEIYFMQYFRKQAEKQAEAAEAAVVAAAVTVTPKVSPKRGRPAATEVKVPKPRGRPKLVKLPCPSETNIVHEEEKTKKKGLEEKPKKQGKKDEESQKEDDKLRKEFDRREAKRETEPKRRNTSQVGSASASDSEEDEGEHEGDKKKKGGRNFQGAHRRNMLQGQHEREPTERKCKQEEQMESEPQNKEEGKKSEVKRMEKKRGLLHSFLQQCVRTGLQYSHLIVILVPPIFCYIVEIQWFKLEPIPAQFHSSVPNSSIPPLAPSSTAGMGKEGLWGGCKKSGVKLSLGRSQRVLKFHRQKF
ncbi:uncharacterized protein WM294_015815 [Sarcoramphus papa]